MKLIIILLIPAAFSGIGFGHMSSFLSTYQDDTAGGSESLFNPHPYASISKTFNINKTFAFLPQAGFVLPSSSHAKNDASKRTLLFLLFDMGITFDPQFIFKLGLGTFVTRISGTPGIVQTANGNSTVNANLPYESRNSYNTTVNIGSDIHINKKWALNLEIFVWNMFSSLSRKFTFSVGGHYSFF